MMRRKSSQGLASSTGSDAFHAIRREDIPISLAVLVLPDYPGLKAI